MEAALILLAIAGLAAAARRLSVALLRLVRSGAETYVAGETAAARARAGDVTGMQEARSHERRARGRRRRDAALLVLWLALLLAPLFTPWTRRLYAIYAVLWLYEAARPSRAVGRAE